MRDEIERMKEIEDRAAAHGIDLNFGDHGLAIIESFLIKMDEMQAALDKMSQDIIRLQNIEEQIVEAYETGEPAQLWDLIERCVIDK